MSDPKQQVLDWIEADRELLVRFLSEFLRAKSPNPPGDTRRACTHVTGFLRSEGLPHREVAAQEHLPNIIGSFTGAAPGRHLVLNGHMDVFPAIDDIPGERSQWSGDVSDGRIYGRGASDMKCGTAALIFVYRYLHRLKDKLRGRLTLTVVSDEETGGKYGSGYLFEAFADEVKGDCCLDAEPSGTATIRFGEKGTIRVVFAFRTTGAHGAYPHLSKSATKLAARFVTELEAIEQMEAALPERVARALAQPAVTKAIEDSLGAGALPVVGRPTVNIGVLRGGLKINMLPDECTVEAEIRTPPGLDNERVMEAIRGILARYPEASMTVREHHSYASSWSDPDGEMVGILQDNVEALKGFRPPAIVSLGGSDARWWRRHGIPAYLYGPSPKSMARRDEHVTIDDFLHVVRTHALSAYDYLTR